MPDELSSFVCGVGDGDGDGFGDFLTFGRLGILIVICPETVLTANAITISDTPSNTKIVLIDLSLIIVIETKNVSSFKN